MSNAQVAAAAEGLPAFDPDRFDLALHHMATMLDLIVDELCEIARDEMQPATTELLRLDSLAWVARDQLQRLSAQFPDSFAKPARS